MYRDALLVCLKQIMKLDYCLLYKIDEIIVASQFRSCGGTMPTV
jgi:hypothetical protein